MARTKTRIPLRLAAGSVAQIELPLTREELTAALFDIATEQELAEAGDLHIAHLALKVVFAGDAMALSETAEAFVLGTWSGTVGPEDLTRWDLCAVRIDAVFFDAAAAEPVGVPS